MHFCRKNFTVWCVNFTQEILSTNFHVNFCISFLVQIIYILVCNSYSSKFSRVNVSIPMGKIENLYFEEKYFFRKIFTFWCVIFTKENLSRN